jgi:hypothetical protein
MGVPSVTDGNQNNIISSSRDSKPANSTVNVMILTPSLLLTAKDEDLCIFDRSGAGSRYLQTLVSPENKKLCEQSFCRMSNTWRLSRTRRPSPWRCRAATMERGEKVE